MQARFVVGGNYNYSGLFGLKVGRLGAVAQSACDLWRFCERCSALRAATGFPHARRGKRWNESRHRLLAATVGAGMVSGISLGAPCRRCRGRCRPPIYVCPCGYPGGGSQREATHPAIPVCAGMAGFLTITAFESVPFGVGDFLILLRQTNQALVRQTTSTFPCSSSYSAR
jgi:hypothetical protein